MTDVIIDIQNPNGSWPAGELAWTPVNRITTDTAVIVPSSIRTILSGIGSVTESVIATDIPEYEGLVAWKVEERVPNGEIIYVLVPTSTAPVYYSQLVRVSPESFDEIEVDPAWVVILNELRDLVLELQTGSIQYDDDGWPYIVGIDIIDLISQYPGGGNFPGPTNYPG